MLNNKIIAAFILVFLPGITNVYAGETDELLASQYLRNGEYEQAVVLYEELFEKNPSSPIFYNNLLECYIQLDDLRQAQRTVRSQINRFPQQIRFEVDYGWIQDLADNQRRARRHFENLISDVRKRPENIIALADAFERRGYLDYALDTYQKGRRAFGNDYPLNRRIAQIYEQKGDLDAMMEELVDMLTISEEHHDNAKAILQDKILDDPDFENNNALRRVLLHRVQRDRTQVVYSEMLLWLSIQQKDFNMALNQARALDRRLNSEGKLMLEVGQLSASNGVYDVAIEAFQTIIELGKDSSHYLQAFVGLLDVKYLKVISSYDFKKEDLVPVEDLYRQALDEMGLNNRTIRLLRNLAQMKAFHMGKTDEAIKLLETAIEVRGLPRRVVAECRVELADILVLTGDVWDANLLYALVDRTFRDDPIAHEARFKNARLSYFIGEFEWAKSQLDVLKAATSKLIANDAMKLSLHINDNIGFDKDTRPLKMYARAEKLMFMNNNDAAMLLLDSIVDKFPTHQILDDVLYAKAGIKLSRGKYEEADSLLAFIVEHFPTGLLADEALYKRAEIQEKALNNPTKAMNLYQQLLTDYQGSINSVMARNHFRRLRDTLVN